MLGKISGISIPHAIVLLIYKQLQVNIFAFNKYVNKILHNPYVPIGILKIMVFERIRRYLIMYYIL